MAGIALQCAGSTQIQLNQRLESSFLGRQASLSSHGSQSHDLLVRLALPHDVKRVSSGKGLTLAMATRKGSRKYSDSRPRNPQDILRVEISPNASDAGRKLRDIADMITQEGAVGIVPTDTVYAIVCDLTNRDAVDRLYRLKRMDQKKPLSILCRSFQDVDTYTLGFPRGNSHGQTNVFRAVRQCLPGPYTFILKASKEMPKQCTTFGGSAVAHCAPRKSVGVRMPADPICQALLELLERPLLCSSATEDGHSSDWLVDPATIGSTFTSADGAEGVDFIIDGGARMAEPSTVVDMTADRPVVLRQGKGEVEDWMLMEPHDSTEEIAPAFLGGKANPYAASPA